MRRGDVRRRVAAENRREAPRQSRGAFSLPAGDHGQGAGGGRASRRGWRARSALPTATRFARHAAAALLQRVGFDPALADLLAVAPDARTASRHWPRGVRAHAARAAAISAGACSASSIAATPGPVRDRRHRHAGHQARAHRRGIPPARPPRCRVRPCRRRRLLAGRLDGGARACCGPLPACAGRARTRWPTRWPTSTAAPVAFVATLQRCR